MGQLQRLKELERCVVISFVADASNYSPSGYSYYWLRKDLQAEGVNQKLETLYNSRGEVVASQRQFWPAIKGSGCLSDTRMLVSKLGLVG